MIHGFAEHGGLAAAVYPPVAASGAGGGPGGPGQGDTQEQRTRIYKEEKAKVVADV